MKKRILYITFTAAIALTAFLIGRETAEPETHINKMEYAFSNVEYWEITDNGLNIYDYNGNVYKWE